MDAANTAHSFFVHYFKFFDEFKLYAAVLYESLPHTFSRNWSRPEKNL